ncbi:MAG: cell division protein ZapA [Rhodothermales bacterium]
MEKSIRVRVLSRDFALRVREEDEAATRTFADHVDSKMRTFKEAHPEQPELTVAIVTALALAEELYAARDAQEQLEYIDNRLGEELTSLEQRLAHALTVEEES